MATFCRGHRFRPQLTTYPTCMRTCTSFRVSPTSRDATAAVGSGSKVRTTADQIRPRRETAGHFCSVAVESLLTAGIEPPCATATQASLRNIGQRDACVSDGQPRPPLAHARLTANPAWRSRMIVPRSPDASSPGPSGPDES